MSENKGKKKKKLSAGIVGGIIAVVVVGIGVVAAIVLLGGAGPIPEDRINRILDYGTITQGVSVNGVDISGMTLDQAYEATSEIEDEMLAAVAFELNVDGEVTQLDARYFGLYTDYTDVMAQAVNYGRVGAFEDRKTQLETAHGTGMSFAVKVIADEAKVAAAATLFKSDNDVAALGAGFEFMPWGYFEADGTAYTPDMDEYMTTISKKKEFVYPEGLATIAPEDMPAQVRYQYYHASYYYRDKNDGEVYIPKDANIARFKYTAESKGVDIDAQGLAQLITASVESAAFGSIEVPAQIIHTDSSVADAMYDTQLLASWTSYLSHNDTSRVYNVAKLSGIINGVIIQPGEEWSINEEAGPRYNSTGWQDAPGYTDGVSIDQPGGGVCQVSSTTYNAFLRAGLEYDDDIKSRRHSTVSDYIPIGLDATISTDGPDLVVTNPYDYPLYIVSYMDGEAKNVTVEIYGRPLTNENGKELIFEFTSNKTSTGDVPAVVYYYDQVQTPFKEPIPPGGYLEYGHSQAMIKANVYRTIYDIDGNVIKEKDLYYSASYPAKTGAIYCNFPQPLVSGNPLVPDPPPAPETPADTGGA